MVVRAAQGVVVMLALAAGLVLVTGWTSFGRRAEGARRARMEASPHFRDGHFENPEPLVNDFWGSLAGALDASAHTRPDVPLQVEGVPPSRFAEAPPSGLRVTWLGHSSLLVEIDGHRILTDPVWSDRVSPVPGVGPTRFYPPLLPLESLPRLDAVVVSHDHYDHLDRRTVTRLAALGTTFVVPLGVGAHLAYWGVPEDRIVELDWWEERAFGDLRVVCTPARHASGRTVLDKDATLWAGWAFVGPKHRAYFSGDTGLFRGMRDIGERLGPFDLTMIETGQYHRSWPDWHIGPEQAVLAHCLVRGRVLLPMHWGLLALAYHGWTEPAERSVREAARAGITLATPAPGVSIEPTALGTKATSRWWPDVPWRTAEEHPIVSSQIEGLNAAAR